MEALGRCYVPARQHPRAVVLNEQTNPPTFSGLFIPSLPARYFVKLMNLSPRELFGAKRQAAKYFVKQPSQGDGDEVADMERDVRAAGSMTQMKRNGLVGLSACSHL